MSVHPLITIGITCFNAEDTIERAVYSALSQNWPNKEIVIVDDCSADKSAEIIERLAREHNIARFVRHEINQGPGAARQSILNEARGTYVAFFDDDDESLPERLSCQYEALSSYEDREGFSLIACYASGQRVYPNGYAQKLQVIGMHPVIPHGDDVAAYILYFSKKPGVSYGGTPNCALMARRSTFKIAGGFDPAFRRVEDLDFAIRLALAGGHFIGCPQNLLIQHATQANDKSLRRNLEAELMLAKKHKDWLIQKGRYEYAKRWPWIRYHHFTGNHGQMLVALAELALRAPFKTISHILESAPKRFLHELRMKKKS